MFCQKILQLSTAAIRRKAAVCKEKGSLIVRPEASALAQAGTMPGEGKAGGPGLKSHVHQESSQFMERAPTILHSMLYQSFRLDQLVIRPGCCLCFSSASAREHSLATIVKVLMGCHHPVPRHPFKPAHAARPLSYYDAKWLNLRQF